MKSQVTANSGTTLGLIFFLFSFIMIFSVSSGDGLSTSYTIDGDTIFIDVEGKAMISQTPHTLTKLHNEPIINVTSYFSTEQCLDVGFLFDTENIVPKSAEYYNPHYTEVKYNYTCDCEDCFFNYTLSPKHGYCYEKIEYNITDNETGVNTTTSEDLLIFDHYFDSGDIESGTIYWTEPEYVEWTHISDSFSRRDIDFDGFDRIYYIEDVYFESGETKSLKLGLDTKINTSGKYGMIIKRCEDTISEAISNDRYVYLDPWWNSSWGMRIPFNTSTSEQTDYQVKATINFSSQYSSGLINSDCSDFRVTDTNDNPIPYWIEECNLSASDNATIWIKTNTASTSTLTGYIYYNNSDATSESSGDDTFIFFDDFDDDSLDSDKWVTYTGTPSESGGLLTLTGYTKIYSKFWSSSGNSLNAKSYHKQVRIVGFAENQSSGDVQYSGDLAYFRDITGSIGSSTENENSETSNTFTMTDDVWKVLRIDWINTSIVKFYINDSLQATHITNIPDGTPTIPIYLYTWSGDDELLKLDYIFDRKIASTEPTFILGTEEEYDETPPTVNLNNESTSTSDTTPTLSFNFTDAVSSTASCELFMNDTGYGTNASVSNNTETTITANTSLSEGNYTTYVNCTDESSNIGQSNIIYVNIDTTAPTITIISPTNTTYNTTSIDLNWSANEDLSWSAYSLNGGSNVSLGYIYQENATTSYGTGNWGGVLTFYKTIDNIWTTYGTWSTLYSDVYGYYNYTKLEQSTIESYWVVKDEIGIENLTLSSDCFNQNPLQFRVYGLSDWFGAERNIWSCWNGATYTDLRTQVSDEIYEEAMWWYVPYNHTLTAQEGSNYITVYANDSSGNMGSTTVYFTVTLDTCTCPAINTNYEINLGDKCRFQTACNIGYGNLTFTNDTAGNYVYINNTFYAYSIESFPDSAIVYIDSENGHLNIYK